MTIKFYFDGDNMLWMDESKALYGESRTYKTLNNILKEYYKKPKLIYSTVIKYSLKTLNQLFSILVRALPLQYWDSIEDYCKNNNLTIEQHELALKYTGEIKEAIVDALFDKNKNNVI